MRGVVASAAVILLVCSSSYSWRQLPQHQAAVNLRYRCNDVVMVKSSAKLHGLIQGHCRPRQTLLSSKESSIPIVSSGSWLVSLKALWDFTRPHTIIGSCVSILSLFMFAVPSRLWTSRQFLTALLGATVPSLLMNLYITGLNQVTDVGIDKINKPYLPLASGSMSERTGIQVVLGSLALSLWNINKMAWPLQYTLVGSALLGTLYSLSPFRLKRFPLLAAL